MFSIKVRNGDFPRAERELRHSGLPVPQIQGQTLMYRGRFGANSKICAKCLSANRRGRPERSEVCPISGKRCPIERTIDIVLVTYRFLQMRRIKATIQI